MLGSWSSDDSYGPGTFELRDDGSYTWLVTGRVLGKTGTWELQGSELTWQADDGSEVTETIVLDGDTLYRDAFVREPGTGQGLSGTWHQLSASGKTGHAPEYTSRKVWEISGDHFEYRERSVAYAERSDGHGHGTLTTAGDFMDVTWDSDDPYGESDHDGRLAVRLLAPDALWASYYYPYPSAFASGPTPLNIWKRTP